MPSPEALAQAEEALELPDQDCEIGCNYAENRLAVAALVDETWNAALDEFSSWCQETDRWVMLESVVSVVRSLKRPAPQPTEEVEDA